MCTYVRVHVRLSMCALRVSIEMPILSYRMCTSEHCMYIIILPSASSSNRSSFVIPWCSNFSTSSVAEKGCLGADHFPSLSEINAWRKQRHSLPAELLTSRRRYSDLEYSGNQARRFTEGATLADRLLLQQREGFQALPSTRQHQQILKAMLDEEVKWLC